MDFLSPNNVTIIVFAAFGIVLGLIERHKWHVSKMSGSVYHGFRHVPTFLLVIQSLTPRAELWAPIVGIGIYWGLFEAFYSNFERDRIHEYVIAGEIIVTHGRWAYLASIICAAVVVFKFFN